MTKTGGNTFRGEAHYYYEGSALSAGPVKRLVLDPSDDVTRHLRAGQQGSPITATRSADRSAARSSATSCSSSAPTRRASASRTNDYHFTNGTEPATIERSRPDAGVRQGDLPQPPRHGVRLGAVHADDVRGHAAGLQRRRRERHHQLGGGQRGQPDARLRADADQHQRQRRHRPVATRRSCRLRGGYFHDNYNDTGIPNTTELHLPDVDRSAWPASRPALQGPIGTQNTPRALIVDNDTTKRGFFNVDYNHAFHAARLPHAEGRLRLPAHGQRRAPGLPRRLRQHLLGPQLHLRRTGQTRARGTYGYYEVNDRGVQGEAGANIHSLYVQDQWTVGNRLTLNLGLRTEDENVPSFRRGRRRDRLRLRRQARAAPRRRLRRPRRRPVQGLRQLGPLLRLDQVRAGARLVRRRHVADLLPRPRHARPRQPEPVEHAGRRPVGRAGQLPRPPRARTSTRPTRTSSRCTRTAPASAPSTSSAPTWSLGVHYVHNNLGRTIEDIGAVDAQGDEAYIIGNPGEGLAEFQFPSGATPLGQPVPQPKRQYDALEFTLSQRFSNNYFWSASYVYSRLYGNYSGLAASEEVTHADDRRDVGDGAAAGRQHRASGRQRQPRLGHRRDLLGFARQPRRPRPAADRSSARRQAVRLLHDAVRHAGRRVLLRRQRHAAHDLRRHRPTRRNVFVNGRGDMGRTDVLTRTDLLVSHELKLGDGNKRLRFELNVLNVFNQKTTRHQFNYLNRGAGAPRAVVGDLPGRRRPSHGYDYNALILAIAGRRQRLRSALRHGRPVRARHAGLLHGPVHLLIVTTALSRAVVAASEPRPEPDDASASSGSRGGCRVVRLHDEGRVPTGIRPVLCTAGGVSG